MIASSFPDMTIVGIDNKTDLRKLPHGCELAFIFSLELQGNRYPTTDEITDLSQKLTGRPLAVHFRGIDARKKLIDGEIDNMLFHIDRILIEGDVSEAELVSLLEKYPSKKIITEHSTTNSGLRFLKSTNHQLIVDAFMDDNRLVWNVPVTEKQIGYRGITDLANFEQPLDYLVENAPGRWWIELEDQLRSDQDWFDAEIASNLFMTFLNTTSPVGRT